MAESLRDKVASFYNDVRFVVDKNPSTPVGEPTLMVLRELITQAKGSSGNKAEYDALLGATASAARLTAAEVLTIAGQLRAIVR